MLTKIRHMNTIKRAPQPSFSELVCKTKLQMHLILNTTVQILCFPILFLHENFVFFVHHVQEDLQLNAAERAQHPSFSELVCKTKLQMLIHFICNRSILCVFRFLILHEILIF